MRKNYLWYQFFRYVIVRPALQLFHSDIRFKGVENIPRDKPILFVGNHQNAFLDALHVVCSTNVYLHFLTRAEPFEMPLLGYFFRSLNMMPVYRVRDGFGTIKKNTETFDRCYKCLHRGESILVFAEASHDLRRRVRPLSKGFTRIAFGGEEKYDWQLDVQVLPVGINYGCHQKSQSPVQIQFGECIPVSQFRQVYQEDEQKAARQLTKATAEGIKKLTMHVPDLEEYPLYHLMLDTLEIKRHELADAETANRRVSGIKARSHDQLVDKSKQLLDEAEKNNIDLRDFVDTPRVQARDVLLSPVYLFSLINNVLPYQVVRWVTQDYIEDGAFVGSAKFLLGLLLLPTFYFLLSLGLNFTGVPLSLTVFYFLTSLLTAPLFGRARDIVAPDATEHLRREKPGLYRSIAGQLKFFKRLRDDFFQS